MNEDGDGLMLVLCNKRMVLCDGTVHKKRMVRDAEKRRRDLEERYYDLGDLICFSMVAVMVMVMVMMIICFTTKH